MKKFFNLPVEKQNKIIDVALKSFGKNGYKKTSIGDIAAAAGISKSMVFHYFGTKKALYFYLIELCDNIIMKEVDEKFNYKVTDFFDRIKLSSNIEISVMRKHPAIPSFLTSMYFENDGEVKGDIKTIILAKGVDFRNKIAFDGVDFSKFKENVDPKLVIKILLWLTDGYMNQLSNRTAINYEAFFKEFEECIDLLRDNLYKEEYV
ncbi:TetR/AcrR family transcriptional regulator [Clostridium sp. MT-14]|uniref:TetR/AcrR family transcriptional regulator n=1 Tax=Clostridium aromativorans TaxID=2836848 RepID=A0ABS8N7A2_9CLOT|nr:MULTISPECIES: TetR/AcrR family transcriptional regulator [Clostridium]KAA8673010.1 TetR/AcrR family transcriptional regulator [Clostridium sp. HV4-5-A1G]MCC9295049.1 TetR/AcrR family transcriptional regulator [Clostridium aromativorans]CAB1251068.1 TetR family transcriptional regulator [Clostridiaceae bacterium BL-3]